MKRLSGFSLMEMMIVLVIVAIVAAASAPMVNKKMVSTSASQSPWEYVNNTPSIAYNFGALGRDNNTASIGQVAPNGAGTPRLYIDSTNRPHMTFGSGGGHLFKFIAGGSRDNVFLSDAEMSNTASNSVSIGRNVDNSGSSTVAIGWGAITPESNAVAIGDDARASNGSCSIGSHSSASGESAVSLGRASTASALNSIALGTQSSATNIASIAIGESAQATGNSSITIGSINEHKDVTASGTSSIAIGDGAQVTENESIAIGLNANAQHRNSIALGSGAETSGPNQIVLGTKNDTVVVPGEVQFENLRITGNLIVDGTTVFRGETFLPVWADALFWHSIGRTGDNDNALRTDRYVSNVTVDGKVYTPLWKRSDRRLKNIGKAFDSGLAEIKKLEVFNYTFKDDKDKTPRVGVIAQDLKKIFPDAVIKGEDGFLRIRMEDMFYALVNAVKELDLKIINHDKRIADLEKQNAELLKRIEKLEQNK